MRLLVAAILSLFVALPAFAATYQATPQTLALLKLKPGDTIVLAEGTYGGTISGLQFDKPIIVDAKLATFDRLVLSKVKGIKIVGGRYGNGCVANPCYSSALRIVGSTDVHIDKAKFIGPLASKSGEINVKADGYGLGVDGSFGINVTNSVFSGFKVGLLFGNTDGFLADNNRFSAMRSDGINIGSGWNGVVTNNVCDGTRIESDEHPDCIQGYSRPNLKPTANILVANNLAVGDTQGFFFGNHKRTQPKGYKLWTGEVLAEATLVDDGGFDNMNVEYNLVIGTAPQGVGLYSARTSTMRNNRTRTLPGAPYIVNIGSSGDVARCGNVAMPGAGKKGFTEAPC